MSALNLPLPFDPDDPYPFDDELRDFHEACRRARDLANEAANAPAGNLALFLDAAYSVVQVTVQGAQLASEAVEDVRSGKLTRPAFIERLLRLDLGFQLPEADDLVLPAALVKLLNANRFWTASGQPPLEDQLNESAFWDLLQLNERLHFAWGNFFETFAWSKWAERIPSELRPATAPTLTEAFAIYFRLPPESKPGKSFANKWKDTARCWPGLDDLPDEYGVRLYEFQQEVQAVRQLLETGENAAQEQAAASDAAQGPAETQYVTLDQMAALVNRSKRTLEHRKRRQCNPLPAPDVEGGGGQPDEWLWAHIRPWLEQEFDRRLPERFPRPPS